MGMQCQLYGHLIMEKISIFYIAGKFCTSFREHATNIIDSKKTENGTIIKRRGKFRPRCKKL